jgi:hypothetical protein
MVEIPGRTWHRGSLATTHLKDPFTNDEELHSILELHVFVINSLHLCLQSFDNYTRHHLRKGIACTGRPKAQAAGRGRQLVNASKDQKSPSRVKRAGLKAVHTCLEHLTRSCHILSVENPYLLFSIHGCGLPAFASIAISDGLSRLFFRNLHI